MSKYKQLIGSIVGDFFISTSFRQCSDISLSDFYETIVWKYDHVGKKLNGIAEMFDSGTCKNSALENHFEICRKELDELERVS